MTFGLKIAFPLVVSCLILNEPPVFGSETAKRPYQTRSLKGFSILLQPFVGSKSRLKRIA